MIDQSQFFEKYRINKEDFEATGLEWDDLREIHTDYVSCRPTLEPTANYIAERLRQVDEVHSLKIRLKDPEHLIEKIIRKKLKDHSRDINLQNYREVIMDLIGIRALHLFKEDWALIHDFITEKWELHEKPIANVREGDPKDFINKFGEKNCDINYHEFGYRSVHYLVKCQPEKELHIAEIQVRTIFEEGWSEIDHRIRYPYDMDSSVLGRFLVIFNRLAGSADEMGSFVKFLRDELDKQSQKVNKLLEEKNITINQLRDQIDKLKIKKEEKERLEAGLDILLDLPITYEEARNTIMGFDPHSKTLIIKGSGLHDYSDIILEGWLGREESEADDDLVMLQEDVRSRLLGTTSPTVIPMVTGKSLFVEREGLDADDEEENKREEKQE